MLSNILSCSNCVNILARLRGRSNQDRVSDCIDRSLMTSREKLKNHKKILLLGPGFSGKSTFLKQMQILHMKGFNDSDYMFYGYVIKQNVTDSLDTLIQQMTKRGIRLENSDTNAILDVFKRVQQKMKEESVAYQCDVAFVEILKRLWHDPVIQSIFALKSQFYVQESVAYFMSHIDRIWAPDYKPTVADIVRSRTETAGIYEKCFEHRNLTIRLFDVSGQKSGRRKWIHIFDDVTAILFITSLSEYDEVDPDSGNANRMKESVSIFKSIVTAKCFETTEILLFLNKVDIFEEKISTVPLTRCFHSFPGGDSLAAK